MRLRRVACRLLAGAMLLTASCGWAIALENNNQGVPPPKAQPAKPTQPKAGGATPALSEAQCRQAGGTVTPEGVCNSAFSCKTTDEKGQSHEVCINKPD